MGAQGFAFRVTYLILDPVIRATICSGSVIRECTRRGVIGKENGRSDWAGDNRFIPRYATIGEITTSEGFATSSEQWRSALSATRFSGLHAIFWQADLTEGRTTAGNDINRYKSRTCVQKQNNRRHWRLLFHEALTRGSVRRPAQNFIS